MTEKKDIKELIEFSELWWGSAQEGEPIAEDEILLVKDLIAALKSQELEIKKLSTCQDCGGTGTNELCHDPYYVVPCICTVDWYSESMELRKQIESQKVEIQKLQNRTR